MSMGEWALGDGGFCIGGAGLGRESPEFVYFGVGGGIAGLGFRSAEVSRGDPGTRGGARAIESREVGAVDLDIDIGRAVDGVVRGFAGLPERDESVDSAGLAPSPCLRRFGPD